MSEMNICGLMNHRPLLSGACKDCKAETCVHLGHRVSGSDYRGMAGYSFYCDPCFITRKKAKAANELERNQRRDYLSWVAHQIEKNGTADGTIRDDVLRSLIKEVLDITRTEVNLNEV